MTALTNLAEQRLKEIAGQIDEHKISILYSLAKESWVASYHKVLPRDSDTSTVEMRLTQSESKEGWLYAASELLAKLKEQGVIGR